MPAAEVALFELAESSFGVVSRAQALAVGFTPAQVERRVAQRRLVPLFPGVYRVAGTPETGRARALAATLWLGNGALVSHLTAATLLRLDGCKTRELHPSVRRDVRKRVRASSVRTIESRRSRPRSASSSTASRASRPPGRSSTVRQC
jgi:hypothetical protein